MTTRTDSPVTSQSLELVTGAICPHGRRSLANCPPGAWTDACSRCGCLSILVMCWSCGRIANAATETSTRHPRTCLCARTSAPGAATARRTSYAWSVRTAAASSSGAPSGRPACSQSTPHRPGGLSGQDAFRHPPADALIGEQEPSRPRTQSVGHWLMRAEPHTAGIPEDSTRHILSGGARRIAAS